MRSYWRVFVLVIALMGVGAYQLYGIFSNEGYRPQQPINYSHVLHAGVMQMECLYCHYQAEKGPYAGIPAVDVCMGCHSIVRTDSPEIQKLAEYYRTGEPVPWVRIHKLPDHSFFNHQWHVAAGVACQECHGPIQEMPVVAQWRKLEMGECMTCHQQDTYAHQVNRVPTYHEVPMTDEEIAASASVVAPAKSPTPSSRSREEVSWSSLQEHLSRFYPGLSATEKQVMQARLKNYQEDIYVHGRVVQLRGVNAAIECSTCHY